MGLDVAREVMDRLDSILEASPSYGVGRTSTDMFD